MKKISILFIITGILLVGCSQNAQIETEVSEVKSNSKAETNETITKKEPNKKLERLDLTETSEIAIFREAVNDSAKVPGAVNITNPQYKFSLGEESFLLWITEDTGVVMNTIDTSTIYSLTSHSIKEINEFVNND